jgi:methyl-accepting chemotaxis protein
MSLPTLWTPYFLQAITLPDTIVARTIPDRGILDWTNGVLQLVVLLLAVGALAVFIMLMLTVRDAIKSVSGTVERLGNDTRPLVEKATALVGDARETVTMLREDVERVTDAAAAISDELLNAAETTARRVDEVNAVLDVLQAELEDTAISAVSAIRGVRVGASEVASRLTPSRGRKAAARAPRTRERADERHPDWEDE